MMDVFSALQEVLAHRHPDLALRTDEPMSRHTTFQVGGPVPLMALPRSEDQARAALQAAAELGVPVFFLGCGSNLLVADAGASCFVLRCREGLDSLSLADDGVTVTAGSGVTLAKLASFAAGCGLTGLEFAGGIPGTLGGGVTMNAGAYDGEMAQVVTATHFLDPDGSPGLCTDHHFGYRHSVFADGSRLLLRTALRLSPGDPDAIRAKMADLSARRRSKQPLDLPSAGSTFRRPPHAFAAALIDGCGLRGAAVGGAQVSEKHAGFVVNRGGATCADILALVDLVRTAVLRQTGIELELEIKTLGV